jgi:predicted GNAT family N-acyltransferase
MLVIRQDWRRRHLLPALYRKAAGVLHSWGVTHVIAIVSQRLARFYRHLGFKPLAEAFVIESIGDTVVPILACADDLLSLGLRR